ncbi:uncharacterized protein LOC101738477 [Bombyx mori]|uniref:Uncharacterized protein n=1 Tax=Bombyx mori TaxID=7091 RepID=A0A8R2AGU3_BOMMO|nr:uncharacterized protein LOC101738477 [Bombyx mori]
MLICAQLRPPEEQDRGARKKALKDAVICIGWLKIVSIICYMILYYLVRANSEGGMSNVLQSLTLAILPPQIVHGILLFLGALEERVLALEIGLWFCLILGSYNTILGIMGGIYFIRTGYLTMHFLLALIFALMAMSLFSVLCHDVLIVYAYKEMLVTTLSTPVSVVPHSEQNTTENLK